MLVVVVAVGLGITTLRALPVSPIGDEAGRPPAVERDDAPASEEAGKPAETRARKVDPRRGGLQIALGEWTIAPEAHAIRPGRVTFEINNRGTMAHGFEIELEGESSGSGSGDLFKAESRLLQPGEATKLTLDLPPGVYKIECLVDGHDDMGMEDILEVRRDAPLQEVDARADPSSGRVAIVDLAFSPAGVRVPAGTTVRWSNDDPTDHTVTSANGTFGSDTLKPGDAFSHAFHEPGSYRYRCAIHPQMEGRVEVE